MLLEVSWKMALIYAISYFAITDLLPINKLQSVLLIILGRLQCRFDRLLLEPRQMKASVWRPIDNIPNLLGID